MLALNKKCSGQAKGRLFFLLLFSFFYMLLFVLSGSSSSDGVLPTDTDGLLCWPPQEGRGTALHRSSGWALTEGTHSFIYTSVLNWVCSYFNPIAASHLWTMLCECVSHHIEAGVQGADGADAAKLCFPSAKCSYGLSASQGEWTLTCLLHKAHLLLSLFSFRVYHRETDILENSVNTYKKR